MIEDLKKKIRAMHSDLSAWRRDFHRNPEVAFKEVRTSRVIREFFEDLGLAFQIIDDVLNLDVMRELVNWCDLIYHLAAAVGVVRRHRLWESYLVDEAGVPKTLLPVLREALSRSGA